MSTQNHTPTSAYDRVLTALRDNNCFVAQAPGHTAADRSVSLLKVAGRVLVHSHSDPTLDVLEAIGLGMPDLFDDPRGVAYRYAGGRVVHRDPFKRFRQSGDTKDASLFHVEMLPSDTSLPVYFVEGENDVLAVETAGNRAVCAAQGAGKAHLADLEPLRGRPVIVVADKDDPGRRHAQQVVELLDGIASSTVIVEAKTGKDTADHLLAGHDLAELVVVAEEISGRPSATREPLPRIWRAVDLRPAEQPRWLAKNRVPFAAVSLLVGDEGIGKSLLWVWLAAAVTTGTAVPEFGIPSREPGDVLVVVTEDDWTTTVRPRLDVAGADLAHINVICIDEDGSGAPVFPRDMPLVFGVDPAPALVVVDAWLDTVDGSLSVRDPQQARRALHPWKEAATVTGAAVLLLTHTNRVSSPNARDKYGATGELRKKARMTLFAQQDDDGALLVGPEKSNTARQIASSKFVIDGVQVFAPTDDHDGTAPLLRYVGDSDRTAREHIVDSAAGAASEEGIHEWLTAYLSDEPKKANDVFSAADQNGFSKDQAKRAKQKLGIRAVKTGTAWFWTLPLGKGAQGSTEVTDTSDGAPLLPSRSKHVETAPLQPREQGSEYPTCTSCGLSLTDPDDQKAGLHIGIETCRTPASCRVCGEPMSLAADRADGAHGMCGDEAA